MPKWICPVCGFKAMGDEDEMEIKMMEHMIQTKNSPEHQEYMKKIDEEEEKF